ncbi:hypothetical protein LEP1GSC186_4336 [Leptospira noguchii serovar Autumnalis str. ZUN142]|uniref:Uncharacterized protein n=1 Tax=Leptospira noguchii serovar Autumnalis str. ZUN142 TaxID=1085540 RepID=M6U7P7_9LEPT|nr:hypothetical protein LEP1GSC186_4336 [Leptospira noguchii serovar Autumnalis str. ZUN142]
MIIRKNSRSKFTNRKKQNQILSKRILKFRSSTNPRIFHKFSKLENTKAIARTQLIET